MALEVAVGQRETIKLENFAQGGETVGHLQGQAVFIPHGIPGETVEAEITEVKKNYARARIAKVLEPSPARIDPPCKYFYQCGGCQWQFLEYKEQLRAKQRIVADTLAHLGGLSHIQVKETIPSSLTYGYRNKVQQPVGEQGGKLVTGFFAPGSHHLVAVEECLVEPEISNKIMAAIRGILPKYRITPYQESRHEGILRHIIVRTGFHTKENMVILVTNSRDFPQSQQLARDILYHCPSVVSILHNINMEKTNVILGKETKVLEGRPFLYETVENLKFKISGESFFQVNTDQAWQICRVAAAYADLKGLETVVDAYCGTGMIGLYLARKAQRVFGLESVAQSVGDAQTNSQLNKVRNVKFVCVDTAVGLQQMKKENVNPQVVVLDPPRQGCDEKVLADLVALGPKSVVYVSCDPATLARDLAYLHRYGYVAAEVQPIDLFPQTAHIECVVKVEQKQMGLI